jgi:hypothetical protein
MALSPFDPVYEEQLVANAVFNKDQVSQTATSADPVVAKRIAEIYKKSPYIPANIILAMAKQGTSDAAISAITPAAAKQSLTTNDPNKKKNKSWFQSNVMDNFKTVSRWSFAALQAVPDVAQNLAAEAFSPNDPAGMDGFFRSTQLGTMLAASQGATMDVTNPDGTITKKPIDNGNGFLIGEDAMKNQAQKAREFRGTINGHAWTVGRGAAQMAFKPGSKPYSLLSGFVDAAFNIGTDPTTYAGPLLKAAKTKKALIPALAGEEALSAASKLAYQGAAGLTKAETAAFDGSKFGQFITQDPRAVRLTERLAAIGADTTKDVYLKTLNILTEFGDNISPEIAQKFAQADSVDKVKGLLGEASARLKINPEDLMLPKDIRDFSLAKATAGDIAKKLGATDELGSVIDDITERVPLYRSIRNSRWFTSIPKSTVVVGGTGIDRSTSIRTYSNYLIGAGIKQNTEQYNNVMNQVVKAYSQTNPSLARDQVHDAFSLAFDTVFKSAGGRSEDAKTVLAKIIEESKAELTKARTYTIDEAGVVTDGGAFQMMRKDIPDSVLGEFNADQWDNLVFQGPGALQELADEMFVLPNFRQVRRLAGSMKFATANKAGDQRGLLTLAEFIQNDIWKPLSLATGGYLMRNMADAQVRIAMTGLDGFFNHPRDYIMWSIKRGKGFADVLGKDFEINADDWLQEQKEFADAMTFGIHQHIKDPIAAQERNLLNGNWSAISRSADATAHTTGYVDNLRLIHTDPINGKISTLIASGETEADSLLAITDWLKSPSAAKERKKLVEYFSQGIKVVDPKTGDYGYVRFPAESITDETMAAWVQKLSSTKINTVVRGDNELRIVAAHNRVPLTMADVDGTFTAIRPEQMDIRDISKNNFLLGEGEIGSIIKLEGGSREGVVLAKKGTALTVQEVHPGSAFLDSGLGSSRLRTLIDQKGVEGKLAEVVKRAERGTAQGADPLAKKAIDVKNHFTDKIFKDLFGTVTQKLERSPVFRQFYYREVASSAELLAPAEAQKLLDRIGEMVSELGIKADNYVGDKETIKKLKEIAASSSDATGTLEELDNYAKAVALKSTKETLFNATERNNLQDVLRIVVPFGTAWTEVLGSYARIAIEDPTRIRRAQLMFEGGRKADMGIVGGQEGQGFFYQDATTGKYSFNFPGSGSLTQLLTGVNAPLQAPVKGLSLGFNFNPGIGPVLQAAASEIIPDTPKTDWIVSMLLPYGRTQGVPLAPKWISQLEQVARGDTMNLETIYGNTYMETIRVLATTGEYDLTDEAEKTRMFADARNKARIIAGLRTLGQFVGPTSPSAEFSVSTKVGDVYATQLVKEFQKLQSENYDTSVKRFLEIYGNDAMLYLSNKTESVSGGLEASEEFGDWERRNGGIMKSYPDVAGFMAEGGDDFSFEVWARQLKKGQRRRLTDKEMVAAAQYKAASAQFRELRKQLPPNPSSEQSAWLRSWRIQLNKEYPGFPAVAQFNPGEFPGKIAQLKEMLTNKSLDDNDVATATKTYLKYRDEAVAQYVSVGGAEGGFNSSNAAAPLREWVAQWGRTLAVETPEFARIYDRLLSYEVEQ